MSTGGPAGPVFVGGTGRSGTTIVARLVGRHPRYQMVRRELRLHAAEGGVADVLAGAVGVDSFVEALGDHWWAHPGANGRLRGAHLFCSEEQYRVACETFRLGYPDEPVGAARGLVEAVLAPSLAGSKKPSWVEMTPRTVVVAEQLAAMFPEARIVHAVRSGLDVASSVRDAGWGPDDMLEALLWWSDRLIAADAGLAALSVDKRHTVHLEQLVEAETQAQTVADLFRFLGVEETRHTTRFVAARITPEEARVGRWRSGLTEREIDHARALYVLLAGRLRRQGVQPLPVDVDDQAKVHRDLPLVRRRRAMLAARGTLIGRQVAGVRARRQPRRSIGG